VRFAAPQIGVGVRAAARDGLESERRNKFFRARRENYIHLRASLRELGGQVRGLERRNGTCDAEQDSFVCEGRHALIILLESFAFPTLHTFDRGL